MLAVGQRVSRKRQLDLLAGRAGAAVEVVVRRAGLADALAAAAVGVRDDRDSSAPSTSIVARAIPLTSSLAEKVSVPKLAPSAVSEPPTPVTVGCSLSSSVNAAEFTWSSPKSGARARVRAEFAHVSAAGHREEPTVRIAGNRRARLA